MFVCCVYKVLSFCCAIKRLNKFQGYPIPENNQAHKKLIHWWGRRRTFLLWVEPTLIKVDHCLYLANSLGPYFLCNKQYYRVQNISHVSSELVDPCPTTNVHRKSNMKWKKRKQPIHVGLKKFPTINFLHIKALWNQRILFLRLRNLLQRTVCS